jgi:hypothetical protein
MNIPGHLGNEGGKLEVAMKKDGHEYLSHDVVALAGREADATSPSFSPFSITNGTHKQIEDQTDFPTGFDC